jgi:hypothetical protein
MLEDLMERGILGDLGVNGRILNWIKRKALEV